MRDDQQRAAEPASTAAFEMLLNSTFSIMRDQTSVNPATSASQMFEPSVADARENRQSTMKGQYLEDSSAAASRRRADAFGVENRAATADIARQTAARSVADGAQGAGIDAAGGRGAAGGGKDATLQHVALLASEDRSGGSSRAAVSTSRFSSNFSSGSGSDQSQAFSSGAGEAGKALAAGGPTVASAQAGSVRSQSSPAADQIGKFLSVDRSSGVDSPRSAATVAGREDARPPASAAQTPQQTGKGSRLDRGESARQGARTTMAEPTDFDSLVKSIRVLRSGARMTSARIHLNPPSLGRIVVDVEMRGRGLHLEIRTESQAAREMLEDRVAQLRSALELFGIHIENFEVVTEQRDAESSAFSSAERDSRTSKPSRDRDRRGVDATANLDRGLDVPDVSLRGINDLGTARGTRRLDVKV